MAQTDLIYPIDTLHGKITKKGDIVFRRKRTLDENGNLIALCRQDAYVIQHPRNWKKNPPKGAEKANMDNWRIACQQAKTQLQDDSLRASWQQRFLAQLKQGEPNAPIDPTTGKPKIYTRLICFVRAAIFRTLK